MNKISSLAVVTMVCVTALVASLIIYAKCYTKTHSVPKLQQSPEQMVKSGGTQEHPTSMQRLGSEKEDADLSNSQNMILGGIEDTQGQFPFQIALVFKHYSPQAPESAYFCSGSMLYPQWIVTAAHCLAPPNDDIRNFVVFATSEDLRSAKKFTVIKKFVHPNYAGADKNGVFRNDIALLKLQEPLSNPATIDLLSTLAEERVFRESCGA